VPSGSNPDHRGPILFLVLLLLVGLLVVAWGAGRPPVVERRGAPAPTVVATSAPTQGGAPVASLEVVEAAETHAADVRTLPGGGTRVFEGNRFLVAYYGTAQTGALGVLGETSPDRMDRRLHRAAAPFRRPGRPMRYVYELIVTVADAHPGSDGDFSHDIPRSEVRRYIRAAHRNHALLLLDLQPGRSTFSKVARRWEWALRDPSVGLALDPEWRMGSHQVPGRTIGRVGATEVNRTAAWLVRLTRRHQLPQKLFVLHQFRVDMVGDPAAIRRWPELATVQHVDGFGTPRQKLDTYHAVARPRQFRMGFKLFYDEDVRRMGARQVLAVRPRVRFVSFQ
jgi:hypothetical protein